MNKTGKLPDWKRHLKVPSLKGSALVYLINYPCRNRVYLVESYIPFQSGRKADGNGSDGVYFGLFPESVMPQSKSGEYLLSENRVESPGYEIRKLINGQINSVLYSSSTQRVLVMAGGYLWKIHPDGYVEDTLRGTSSLRDTGIQIWTDSYRRGEQRVLFEKWNDWLFSGDKYDRDPEALPMEVFGLEYVDKSPDQVKQNLYERLSQAELVEFYRLRNDSDNPLNFALVKECGKWTRLDISRTSLEIDESCSTYKYRAFDVYNSSCLQGFTRNLQDLLEPLKNKLPYHADLGDETLPLRVKRFKRKFYTYEDGFGGWLLGKALGKYLKSRGMSASTPESFWVGMADLTLDFREENFSFKGLVTRKDSRFEMDNFMLYDLPPQSPEGAGFIEVTYKGAVHNYLDRIEKFVEYHEHDVGFYAIRRKDSIRGGVKSNTALLGSSAGSEEGNVEANSWQMEFSGPWRDGKFANYLWGYIAFRDGKRPAHFLLDPVFVQESFHQLPESVEWVWDGHVNQPAYALRHEDEPVLWLNLAATPPRLRLDLDQKEVSDAFAQLSSQGPNSGIISLRIELEPIHEVEGQLKLFLVNKDREFELHRAKLRNLTDLDAVTFFEPDERSRIESRFNRGRLKILFEHARVNPDNFANYVSAAKQRLQESSSTYSYAPIITEHAVKHFLGLIEKDDMMRAKEVFYDYVHQLLPEIREQQSNDESVIYNITVFASQGLMLAIRTSDKILEKIIFEEVIEPDLDLSTQTNATFLYNLACYYSLHENKPKLIIAMKRALELGKPPEQFRQDSDFQNYRGDSDFEKLLLDKQ
ncbi:MAG: hypothetical protein P8171_20310 [Candidatus Thiodiazotropha sp.]